MLAEPLALTKLRELNHQKLYSNAVQLGSMLVSGSLHNLMKNCVVNAFMFAPSITQLSSQIISQSSSISFDELNSFCSVLFEYSVALRNYHQPLRSKMYLYQTLCLLQHLKNHAVQASSLMMKIYEVQEQMGLCCLDCEEIAEEALIHFEAIPVEFRSVQTNMTMGQLYQKKGASVAAIQAYQQVLQQNPYAFSAIQHLIELSGHQVEFVKELYANAATNPLDKWVHLFVDALYAKKHHKYKRAMKAYEAMNQIFPNNPEVLASISECKARILDIYRSKEIYEKALSVDEYLTCEASSYGLLLRRVGDMDELQRLAYSLLKQAKKCPETWATLSIYYESKGMYEKALKFAQQSIDLDGRFVMGYLLKANILGILSRFAEAVTCYHDVHFFSKDIRIYQGLVNCYMSIPQMKDALSAAQMACKLHPQHFKSAVLLGSVYNQKSDTRDQARQEYERAIEICQKESEPGRRIAMEECLVGLVDVEMRNNNLAKAIILVKDRLEEFNSDALYMKLGELYMKAGDHTEAMHNYQIALGLNPKNDLARRGLEEIELLMQPDEVDDDGIPDEDVGDDNYLDEDDGYN